MNETIPKLGISAGAPTLGELMVRYEARRALGPDTRTAGDYKAAWSGLVAWLTAPSGAEPTLSDLTVESVNAYLASGIETHGWSEQTVATYAGNIRSVASALRRFGLAPADTLAGFEIPRVTQREPVYFDERALAAIFGFLEHDRTTLNLRLRAVG